MSANGFRDYFKVLGWERVYVVCDADGGFKRRFAKTLARQFHPCMESRLTGALKPSQRDQRAYGSALRSGERRRKYEQFGQLLEPDGVAVSGAAAPRLRWSISGVTATSTISSNDLLRPLGGQAGSARLLRLAPGASAFSAAFPEEGIPLASVGPRDAPIAANLDAESHDQPQLRRGLQRACERALGGE